LSISAGLLGNLNANLQRKTSVRIRDRKIERQIERIHWPCRPVENLLVYMA
jgi:hypothetical protein